MAFVILLLSACSVSIVPPKDPSDGQASTLFSSRPNISAPAHFRNHQAASLVLGQKDFSSVAENRGGSKTHYSFGEIDGQVAIDSGHLYVMDSGNSRLLFFNNIPTAPMSNYDTSSGSQPNYAIGADWELKSHDPQVWTNFGRSYNVVVSGGKVFIGDHSNGRVLVWNHPFTEAGPPGPPDQVIGQVDFIANDRDCSSNLANPKGVMVAGSKLIISDSTFARIYIWNKFPEGNAVPTSSADLILGRSDCTSGIARNELNGPRQIWSDGVRLVVGDADNNRVLIWNTFPTQSDQNADIVLGDEAGNWGTSKTVFNNAYGVVSNGTQLFLAEPGNCRILIWDTFPTVDHQEPTGILGHDSFTEDCGASTASATDMTSLQELFYYDKQLWVGGYQDNRVLMFQGDQPIYNVAEPAVFTNMQGAELVLGQPSFEASDVNRGVALSSDGMNSPDEAMVFDSGHAYLIDSSNDRMIYFDQIPQGPMSQYGSAGSYSVPGVPMSWQLSGPRGIAVANGKTIISDVGSNNRILIWNQKFDATHPLSGPPDTVIGQVDLASEARGDCSQNLGGPRHLVVAGEKLILSDADCNRLLIWNHIPTAAFVGINTADLVVGNIDGTSGLSLHELSGPRQIWSDGERLVVADRDSSRILIWSHFPTRNNQDADLVLGDAGGATGTSATLFDNTYGVTSNGTQLFVADMNNCRVLIWDHFPTVTGQPADKVLGQLDMTSKDCSSPSAYRFGSGLRGLSYFNRQLWVHDSDNNRVLMFQGLDPAAPRFNVSAPARFTDYQAASLVLGEKDFLTIDENRGGAETLYSMASLPGAVAIDSGHLYVMDGAPNDRVLFFNQLPTAPMSKYIDAGSGEYRINADWAFTSPNTGVLSNILDGFSVVVANGRVIVGDTGNSRVLIWNHVPSLASPLGLPDVVLGQADFLAADATACSTNMGSPKGIFVAGEKLIVADSDGNRVFIWNKIPTASALSSSADLILGDPTCNAGISRHEFSQPRQIWSDGVRLTIADANNNRVLIWNTFPTTFDQDADFVLGDEGGASGTSNALFSTANGVVSNGTQLFVLDQMNCRVLIWDQFPTASSKLPTGILGHGTFSETCSAIGSAKDIGDAKQLTYRDKQLWVSGGFGSHRVLMFQGQ